MTNPMFNTQPNYSGVTIQIANPTVYARGAGMGVNRGGGNGATEMNEINNPVCYNNPQCIGGNNGGYVTTPSPRGRVGEGGECLDPQNIQSNGINGIGSQYPYGYVSNGYATNPQQIAIPMQPQQQAYPPQYYLNNYNVNSRDNIGNGLAEGQAEILKKLQGIGVNDVRDNGAETPSPMGKVVEGGEQNLTTKEYSVTPEEPQDFTKSNAVIADLDARALAEAEAKKNSKQKRVVALTDEYIKSLENYLNNPNDEIRVMASKEILKRLDEDKERFDDAALNALLNKMLQDPSKLVRVASMSAFAAQLASGNDYTVHLLHNIQQNPSADKEDVLQAADILLKMSAGTEIQHIPNPAAKPEPEMSQTSSPRGRDGEGVVP